MLHTTIPHLPLSIMHSYLGLLDHDLTEDLLLATFPIPHSPFTCFSNCGLTSQLLPISFHSLTYLTTSLPWDPVLDPI